MRDEFMVGLRQRLEVIAESMNSNKVVYLDYPIHTNGGDLLIFLGTLEFFRVNNIEVLYAASCHNYSTKKLAKLLKQYPDLTIVLHGGGNFGDLYSAHQNLRRDVFREFHEANILLFPQTAFYKDSKNTELDRELVSKLENAKFFARDLRTYNLFKDLGAETELSPDIAHQLLDFFPNATNDSRTERLYFLRNDIEAIAHENYANKGVDWSDLLTRKDVIAIRLLVNIQKRTSLLPNLTYKIWSKYSELLMKRLAHYFQLHAVVETSRLHGHIFSCLLKLDNCVIDNSYGKNSSYIDMWTKNVSYFLEIKN